MTVATHRIGFVGSGQMASALARGFIQAGRVAPTDVCASDVSAAAREAFERATGARTVMQNAEVLESAELIVLAVKPQVMPAVLAELRSLVTERHLIVSIAAGIPLATLAEALGDRQRLVRVMPNTPALVGASASGFALGGGATAADADAVRDLFSAVGYAVQLPELLLDAVTGLSGSGPAFVYLIIEALSDGGVRVGLPREVATRLAAHTVLGAARMVLETGQHPGPLKDAVTSPGGTTIAGLHALERGGLRGTLMNAVEAATLRAQELGRGGK